MRSSIIAAALLAACAQAIKVTSPTKDQVVDLSAGIKVTFETVATDPTTAHLFLVNMAGGSTPFSKDLGEIDLTKSFVVVTEEDVPAQKGYQFNVQSVDEHNTGILAQSQQFEVKEAAKKAVKSTTEALTSTKVSTAATTGTATASGDAADVTGTSTFATVTSSATGTATGSGSAANASGTSTSEAAAPTGKAVAGGSLLALAVAGLVAVVA